MTIINGANHHHTVEDLLSSIRTSISDDHGSVRQGPSMPMVRRESAMPEARRESAMPEESAEFELPAIFKPGHHHMPAEKHNNLFGRLSDALKPAAADPDRPRTVIRFEPAGGRMIEPPPAVASAHVPRGETPSDPAERSLADNNSVKREMPTFFDTRLNRLGEMTRQANAPKPVDPPEPVQQAIVPQPPPLRQQFGPADGGGQSGGLEDAAAQLLRPILKQWLTDNMPKIVEKALRSEAGEDFPPPGGRKPRQ